MAEFIDLEDARHLGGLLADPSIYSGWINTVVFGGICNSAPVILDTVDNLLLHFGSDAMLFHMHSILTGNSYPERVSKF